MRWKLALGILLFCGAAMEAGPARAGALGWLLHDIQTTFQHNRAWPEIYLEADRHHVAAPFAAMQRKGWEEQNMLGAHHFDLETNRLTEAGLIKLRWIITQGPLEHRTVFVERDIDPTLTAQRMQRAREAAQSILVDGTPHVQPTEMVSHGSSGAYFDSVYQKFQSSTPEPRLPACSNAASGP